MTYAEIERNSKRFELNNRIMEMENTRHYLFKEVDELEQKQWSIEETIEKLDEQIDRMKEEIRSLMK